MKFATEIGAATLAAALVLQPAAFAAGPSVERPASLEEPSHMLQSAAKEMLKALDRERAQLRRDPPHIRAIVKE